MFAITQHKGFQITFANGWTVSVQWGPGNYCANQNFEALYDEPSEVKYYASSTAEVAAWDKNKVWYDFGSDTVKGYLVADEVAEFIARVSKF